MIDLDFWRSESRGSDEFLCEALVLYDMIVRKIQPYQTLVTNKLSREPEERLLEVVVGLGRDVVVLEILLAVECDGLGLDFTLLYIDFVAREDNGNVLTHANEISVPVGNVFVGNTGRHIEHDDSALAVDVVAITQTAEFFLTCRVPDVELNLTEILG